MLTNGYITSTDQKQKGANNFMFSPEYIHVCLVNFS